MKEIPPVGNANRLQVLRENNFEKGQEIAKHIKEKHGGVPATSCHRCMTLNATYRDGQLLIALEEEETRQPASRI